MSTPEQEVRAMFAQWFDEAASKDLEAVMSHVADDVVSYEHDSPLQYIGVDRVREVCAKGFDATPDNFQWDVPESSVMVRGDLAVQWGLNRMASTDPSKPMEMWSRGTRVLRKIGGEWLVIHQHVSFPYDADTERARTDLKP